MIGTAGNEKSDDVLVTVDLSHKEGIEIELISKIEKLFGKQMKEVVLNTLKELNIEKAKVVVQDFGALDFVIKARVKTAINRARGNK
ncbi:citrate lyase acyl carrier protein [Clostridium hydrogeniformans]|uniref:citrate lyase acyl carrier protein n=1 Tax=Clostridium hydrogeniformans TaxID=349933 RepID=UPI00047FD249|nr:citrate lyase acyl carrier protein [Clostridium hydrogeniformans]